MADEKQPRLTVKLDPPLGREGEKCDELLLREPLAREVYDSELEVEKTITPLTTRLRDIALIAAVGGIDVDVVRQLPIRVFNQANAYLRGFVEGFPATPGERTGNTLSIELTHALRLGASTIDVAQQLDLGEPTAGDVEAAERELRGGVTARSLRLYQMTLVSRTSKLPMHAMFNVPISKLNEASRYVANFIEPSGQATGEI